MLCLGLSAECVPYELAEKLCFRHDTVDLRCVLYDEDGREYEISMKPSKACTYLHMVGLSYAFCDVLNTMFVCRSVKF